MDFRELTSFALSDAIKFHNELNPKLWNGQHLRPEVEKQLKEIAEDFLEELGISGLDVKDLTISGSNAAYSYTPNSDVDLHIVVDMNKLPNNEVYRELFQAKKTIYNDSHDITIHGVPVELYVQDSNEPVVSLGEYSLLDNKWLQFPNKRRANLDQNVTRHKYEKLAKLVEYALASKDVKKVNHILKTIKRYRQAGLDQGGEFSPENLAYKMLRSQGYIDELYKIRDKLHSEKLSIESMYATEEGSYLNKRTPSIEQLVIKYKVPKRELLVQLAKGIRVEKEHTKDEKTAREIALDHLGEDPRYYTKLQKANLEENLLKEYNNFNKISEAFDQPYPLKWESSDYGDVDALARLPDGSPLSIMFNQQQGDDGDSTVQVEFYRNNSQEVTGEGDAQRIFATVLTAIQKYIKKYKPLRLSFSASKDNWAKQQQNSESRASLYDRLVQRYAKSWGYRAFRADNGDLVIYELNRIIKQVAEASEPQFVYHVTPTKNLKSIAKQGLVPTVGDRSAKISSEKSGVYVFPDQDSAENAVINWLGDEFDEDEPLTMLKIDVSGLQDHISKGADYELIVGTTIEPSRIKKLNVQLEEASGYIPSEKEKNDPRFKTALTVDVKPDSIKKNAKSFYWNTSRAGIPPTANPNGKF